MVHVWTSVALICAGFAAGYEVPGVKIEVLSPKGLVASIPDEPGIGLFAFNANVNSAISSPDVGDITGEVLQARRGRWSFRSENTLLRPGDTLHYWVMVSKDQLGYIKDNLQFKYDGEGTSPARPTPASQCDRSATTVRGRPACAGQVIFHDDFQPGTERWTFQQYIPSKHPDYPFVSYQNVSTVISATGGSLRIAPALLHSFPGYSQHTITTGTLDLFNGCTEEADSCHMTASGSNILPPVVSGRATTRDSFSFKYGVVKVRAMLPKGDWFYPEIVLEPSQSRYGTSDFSSGLIIISTALGNRNLTLGSSQLGVTRLLAGAVVDRFHCHDRLLVSKMGQPWSDHYHDYEVRWTPDALVWSVDGEEIGRVQAAAGSLGDSLGDCPGLSDVRRRWSRGDSMAPFDQEFHLSMGVSAGGVTMFPDGLTGKPWSNLGSKAKLYFWRYLQQCASCQMTQILYVDTVTVTAL